MDSKEIDFYLKIEEEIKKEMEPVVQVNNLENKETILVSDRVMKCLLEEFEYENIEEYIEYIEDDKEANNEIERLKAEIIVKC
jgi:chemotaxis methyl-accepting protein methylase